MGSVIICYVRKQEFPAGEIIMAMEPNYAPDPGDWVCTRCQCPLEQVKVQVGYLGSAFDVIFAPLPVLWADDDPQVAG